MEADTCTAKTHLSRLLDQVERGKEVIITRRGKKVARLVRFEEEPAAPRPIVVGLLRDKFPPLPADMGEDPAWQDIIQIMEQGEPQQR